MRMHRQGFFQQPLTSLEFSGSGRTIVSRLLEGKKMIVVDAHEDIAYNALAFGRDYRRSALEIRLKEANSDVPARNGTATVGLPDALLGRVALTFATLFVAPRDRKSTRLNSSHVKS